MLFFWTVSTFTFYAYGELWIDSKSEAILIDSFAKIIQFIYYIIELYFGLCT